MTEPVVIEYIERNWSPIFANLPHKSISGNWLWLEQCYCRHVHIYTGFIPEPIYQYGTILDILRGD